MACPEKDEIKGEVTGFLNSPDGDIAFVQTEDYGPVSVLLDATCWRGTGGPKKGEVVVISGLSRYPKGWRAMSARRFTLADENTEN